MITKYWPRILYRDGTGNRTKPSEGLCEAKILLDTAKIILESPLAVLPAIRLRPGAPRQGRKGIGSKYELNQVTTGFVAYVAVILRFALSAEEIFSDDGGSFNYVQFYTELRDYLERPKFKSRANALITHWNKTLFPNSIYTDNNVGGEDGNNDGMLVLLEAEVDTKEDSEGAED
ncbi:hypothetical protein FRC06_004694 [Ceratobasidium sp. 370]|nr:hypothetical protein FRC06_004694 [Ceratobasidium sp. 370]